LFFGFLSAKEEGPMSVGLVSAYTSHAQLYRIVSGKGKASADKNNSTTSADSTSNDLTPDQKDEVEKLQKRDQQVRAHEQAHIAAGGAYVKGGATFQYQKGPDGKMYAIGGEVTIDTSPVKGDPQATIAKMETVKAAALAPADPSGQDRSVAAQAEVEEAQARRQAAAQKTKSGDSGSSDMTTDGKKTSRVSTYSAQGASRPFESSPGPSLDISG
jgi:hypothetical protein